MKLLTFISGALILITSSSCSTYKSGSVSESDDRYYSLTDANKERRAASKLVSNSDQNLTNNQNQNSDSPSTTQDDSNYKQYPDASNYTQNQESSGANITNNYYGNNSDNYDMDDYYDYMYSSRIRRFHNNNLSGMGYYNPFYTNTYFYNNDPMFFGNSIYSSYGFFNPYVPWGYGGSGLNFGWNSFTGFNIGFGYSNPYFMYNNPWRWNTWGYNPWSSPFGYNPWGYNPWGYYGMNSMFGCSNMYMYNNMMNSPVYYNSYDNNTFVQTVNNYGPNTPGAGGGTYYKPDDNISSVFGKGIGQSVSASSASVKDQSTQGKNPTNLQNVPVKPIKETSNNSVNPTGVVSTPVKGQVMPGKVEPTVNPGKADNFTAAPIQGSAPVKNQQGTVTPSPGKKSAADNYTSAPKPAQGVATQGGKQDLINSGVIRNDNAPSKPAPTSNYSSAPVNQPKERSDNQPSINRPANIAPVQETPALRDQQPAPIRSQQQLNEIPRNQQGVNPRNNSNNSGLNDANQVQPNQNPSRNNYQQYEAPRNNQQPSNYQQYEAPRNNQQYEAPRNNQQPRNYQQYEAPRNNQQPRNYQQYEAPKNNQQYQTPRNNQQYQQQPRNNYQAPSNRNESAPKSSPRYENSAPSRNNNNSSPRMESPRQSSSPSHNSSGGSFKSGNSRSSGSGNSSGSKNSSPRR